MKYLNTVRALVWLGAIALMITVLWACDSGEEEEANEMPSELLDSLATALLENGQAQTFQALSIPEFDAEFNVVGSASGVIVFDFKRGSGENIVHTQALAFDELGSHSGMNSDGEVAMAGEIFCTQTYDGVFRAIEGFEPWQRIEYVGTVTSNNCPAFAGPGEPINYAIFNGAWDPATREPQFLTYFESLGPTEGFGQSASEPNAGYLWVGDWVAGGLDPNIIALAPFEFCSESERAPGRDFCEISCRNMMERVGESSTETATCSVPALFNGE
ncbi:MAG: hypothetical protein AAFZ18_01150 [Myxococcota bacterium]